MNISIEEWHPVAGYEGYYEISNLARVKSLTRGVELKNGQTRLVRERLLAQQQNKEGYFFVKLSTNGQVKSHFIHRLVAIAFIPNPFNLPQVNHLKSKSDNTPDDLEWSTPSNNTQHSYDNGLNKHKGGQHFMATGVVDNQLGQTFETIKEWADARGIPYSTARNVLSGCNTSTSVDKTLIIKLKNNNNEHTLQAK